MLPQFTAISLLFCLVRFPVTTSTDCFDYRSCEDQNITGDANCLGADACVNSVIDGGAVLCRGYSSCAEANITATGHLEAAGEFSLFRSNVVWNGSEEEQYLLSVSGYRGLSDAEVFLTSSSLLNLNAFMSAPGAVIRSSDSNIQVRLFGGKAGLNTTIICNAGDICSINCHGDACNGLTLIGDAIIECNQDAEYSEVCSDRRSFADFIAEFMAILGTTGSPTLPYMYYSDECTANVDDICYESYGCDVDYTSTNVDSLCCYGTDACSLINIWDVDGDSLLCDGRDACHDTDFVEANQLFIRGYQGIVYSKDIIGIDVYCTAQRSCYNLRNIIADNLFCYGVTSCRGSSINEANNVHALAVSALVDGTINSTESLYCNGRTSCSGVIVRHVGNGIYAKGYNALEGSELREITNDVAAFGYQAMESASVVGASGVYCDGTFCLKNSEIRSVGTVKADGSDCLVGADIKSDLGGQNFVIEIYQDNSAAFQVVCSEGDDCYIGCFSSAACLHMTLHCNGTCRLDCAENEDIACPIGFNVTTNSTVTSTMASMPLTTISSMLSAVELSTSYATSTEQSDDTLADTFESTPQITSATTTSGNGHISVHELLFVCLLLINMLLR